MYFYLHTFALYRRDMHIMYMACEIADESIILKKMGEKSKYATLTLVVSFICNGN